MIIKIDIDRKVISPSNNFWYLDKSGNRFDLSTIKNIIDGKCNTENITFIINMKKWGNTIKGDGITIQRLYSKGSCVVICEDSAAGFVFYKYVLSALYPLCDFVFLSFRGNANFSGDLRKIISEYSSINDFILLIDNKLEVSNVATDIASLPNILKSNNKNYIIFSPICVEEVLLSCKGLYANVHDSVVYNLWNNNTSYFNIIKHNGDYWYQVGTQTIKNLEAYYYDIIANHGGQFKFTKGSTNFCIIMNCCCKQYQTKTGYQYLGSRMSCWLQGDKIDYLNCNKSLVNVLAKGLGNFIGMNKPYSYANTVVKIYRG